MASLIVSVTHSDFRESCPGVYTRRYGDSIEADLRGPCMGFPSLDECLRSMGLQIDYKKLFHRFSAITKDDAAVGICFMTETVPVKAIKK